MAMKQPKSSAHMKLMCTVIIHNRLSKANMLITSKGVVQIEITTPGHAAICVSTKKDIMGFRYHFRDIETLHKNFIGEGKLTIEMRFPEENLMIRHAVPEDLIKFVSRMDTLLSSPSLLETPSTSAGTGIRSSNGDSCRGQKMTLPSTSPSVYLGGVKLTEEKFDALLSRSAKKRKFKKDVPEPRLVSERLSPHIRVYSPSIETRKLNRLNGKSDRAAGGQGSVKAQKKTKYDSDLKFQYGDDLEDIKWSTDIVKITYRPEPKCPPQQLKQNRRTYPDELKVTKRAKYPPKSEFHSSRTNVQMVGLQWSKIDSRLLPLTKLTTLDLSMNALQSIEVLYNLKSVLQSLTLDNNLIECISPDFFNSPSVASLNFLSLKGNQLRKLPRSIVNLKNIQTLNLGGNRLQVLPYNLHKLERLVKLSLNDNLLQFLPHSITLMELGRLDISNNPFTVTVDKDVGPARVQLETFPTLYELTARFISTYNHKNRFKPAKLINVTELPASTIDMLESCKYCVGCGGMTPRFVLQIQRVAVADLALATETMSLRTFVPTKKVVCNSCDRT